MIGAYYFRGICLIPLFYLVQPCGNLGNSYNGCWCLGEQLVPFEKTGKEARHDAAHRLYYQQDLQSWRTFSRLRHSIPHPEYHKARRTSSTWLIWNPSFWKRTYNKVCSFVACQAHVTEPPISCSIFLGWLPNLAFASQIFDLIIIRSKNVSNCHWWWGLRSTASGGGGFPWSKETDNRSTDFISLI